jgi:hypothetical protein
VSGNPLLLFPTLGGRKAVPNCGILSPFRDHTYLTERLAHRMSIDILGPPRRRPDFKELADWTGYVRDT